jgi:hypothetical protein
VEETGIHVLKKMKKDNFEDTKRIIRKYNG